MGQNKKYYWLKLKENFFEEKQIKYLRSLPDGDKIVIAYLKMQLKSLKTEGFIKYDSILPSNIDELAMVLDENTNTIKLMIGALQKVNAVEILDDGSFYMIAMQDLIGKEGESAERVRRFRKNEQLKALQCNSDVTKCNTEIEIEIEKEIEKEIDKDIDKENKKINYQQIADMYNDICISFPKCKSLSDARKKAIKARLKTYSVGDFKNLFEIAEMSDFLKGNNDRNWNATFDWLIKDSNMAKVLDGNYNNKNKGGEINDIRRKDKKVVERELDENEREINRIFGIES